MFGCVCKVLDVFGCVWMCSGVVHRASSSVPLTDRSKWEVVSVVRCGKKIRDLPISSGCSLIISIACTTNMETPTREMVSVG
jgi:hypothetical protein